MQTPHPRVESSARPVNSGIRLNIGCGHVQPTCWVNIDNSNRAKLASRLPWLDRFLTRTKLIPTTEFNRHTRCVNVTKSLPWKDHSVEAVYCGELLEHLTPNDGEQFIAECFRVLQPKGVLRVRVPDNYQFWREYVREFERTVNQHPDDWNDGHTRWIKMFFRDICVRRPILGSMGHFHKWMYDEISLVLLFRKIGFHDVARRTFLDSRIPDIAAVEVRDDLIVEGVKP